MRLLKPRQLSWILSLLFLAGCVITPAREDPGKNLDRRIMFTVVEPRHKNIHEGIMKDVLQ